MANDPVRADPAMSKLRRLKPDKLVVELRDGTERKVAMPTAGNKWQRLGNLLDPMAWTAITAYDKADNCLGVVENAGDADDDDDEDEEDVVEDRDERMARIIAKVVKDTMSETKSMFAEQMKANADIVRGMGDANKTLVETFRMAMSVQAAAGAAKSAAPDDGTPEMAQMVQAFLMMMAGNGMGLNPFSQQKPALVPNTDNKKEG